MAENLKNLARTLSAVEETLFTVSAGVRVMIMVAETKSATGTLRVLKSDGSEILILDNEINKVNDKFIMMSDDQLRAVGNGSKLSVSYVEMSDINSSVNDAQVYAANASASATIAENAADRFLGPSAIEPTTRDDGSPLQAGDFYLNTANNTSFLFDGSVWLASNSSINGTYNRQLYTATAGQTNFNVTYNVGFVDVWMNGIKLVQGTNYTATSGTEIVLTSPAAAGDTIDILAFGAFQVADAVPLTGGLMTGALTLSADPTLALHAATKQYVDNQSPDIASQAEAIAGTDNTKLMTALRTKQLLDANTDPPLTVYTYENRASLRAVDGPAGAAALVRGLGLFAWQAGSTAPDDDETAFSTTTGVWLLEAAAWDVAYAYWLPDVDGLRTDVDSLRTDVDRLDGLRTDVDSLRTDVDRLDGAPKILLGTATCSISSVSTAQGADFTAAVTGAAVGDPVAVNPPGALETSTTGRLTHHAWVSAPDTVTIRIVNPSASTGTINPVVTGASNPWRIAVFSGVN